MGDGSTNIWMSAKQLAHNSIYRGGEIFNIFNIVAQVAAKAVMRAVMDVEKRTKMAAIGNNTVMGSGIPSVAVCRHLLAQNDGNLMVRKNNVTFKVTKPESGKGFFLAHYRYRGGNITGQGFFLRAYRGGCVRIHRKTNADINKLHSLFF